MKIIKTFAILLLLAPALVFAQNKPATLTSAGLTPESNFYFLDKLGEAFREFFTFNPDSKAHLQITFAAERIAEIKVILETKGVEAKGLEVAQSRLQAHLANAATIVVDQKADGKDVSQLAKELDDEFDAPKIALEQAFKAEKRTFEVQEEELKARIRVVRQAGDTVQVESLVQQLSQAKAQKKLLELKEEKAKEALEKEEERIEEEMEVKEEVEKKIREITKEKQEILEEATKDNIVVPSGVFDKLNSLLAQVKSAIVVGNYQEAKLLAKQAEKNLDIVEETIEDLDEAKEEEEELKEKQEEKEREVKKKEYEEVKKEIEKDAELLKKEEEKAEEATKKAEEQLRNAGDEEESD